MNEYLNSVLNQTYKNLEIICVDDGSPDNCGEILDEYAKKDLRIKVIHKANAGYANAVNSGIDAAKGDYIAFADPDDWVELDYYEKALFLARETVADIVISNFYREYSDKTDKMENLKDIPETFTDKNAALRYGFEADVYRGFKMYLCNKLFKSKFFKDKQFGGHGLRMDGNLSTGADSLLSSQCFLKSSKFAYTNEAFYHYRIRENSLMRNTNFSRRLGFNTALERILETLKEEGFDEDIINLIKRFHTYYCSQLAEFAFETGDSKNLLFSQNEMRKYLKEYMASSANYPDRITRINKILSLAGEEKI